MSNSSLDLFQVLQISTCTLSYIICYLEQQEWESFARKCQVESATWVRVGVLNACDMCKMHKKWVRETAESLRCSQINHFSSYWSKVGPYSPSSTSGFYPPPTMAFLVREEEVWSWRW